MHCTTTFGLILSRRTNTSAGTLYTTIRYYHGTTQQLTVIWSFNTGQNTTTTGFSFTGTNTGFRYYCSRDPNIYNMHTSQHWTEYINYLLQLLPEPIPDCCTTRPNTSELTDTWSFNAVQNTANISFIIYRYLYRISLQLPPRRTSLQDG